jgi:hypothetical protein
VPWSGGSLRNASATLPFVRCIKKWEKKKTTVKKPSKSPQSNFTHKQVKRRNSSSSPTPPKVTLSNHDVGGDLVTNVKVRFVIAVKRTGVGVLGSIYKIDEQMKIIS